MGAENQKFLALSANVAAEMDLRRIIVTVEAHLDLGPIYLWAANACIPSNGSIDVPNDEWERIWQVNTFQHVVITHLNRQLLVVCISCPALTE